ncbi:MAG: NTP transferase domain-containing protein [Elusimicrobia bacterium]|nr:NTP transferase domain-containing protein [Elusimicrobiota bacterium]
MKISSQDHRWAIVLAGGEGERMRRVVRSWIGEHRPKQYCAFTGKKSMLEHTLRRAGHLVAPERVVTVIGQGHRAYMNSALTGSFPGRLIEQPANRGTLPGILLPLSYILSRDPAATVLIFPSDHFVYPLEPFLDRVAAMAACADRAASPFILLGAVPDRPEPEYGWIEPADRIEGFDGFRKIARFYEKPAAESARAFFMSKFLWNTMIMAARARSLWDVAAGFYPDLARRFEALRAAMGTPMESSALEVVYHGMPSVDFSHGIVEKAVDREAVAALEDVAWSDWGQPSRIVDTLTRIGRRPVFPYPEILSPVTAGSARR